MGIRGTSLGLAVALVVVAGTSAAAQNLPQVPVVRAHDGDQTLRRLSDRIVLDSLAIWHEVSASPARVYSRVRQILDSLQMPYSQADSAGGLLANPNLVTRGARLAGRANSKSFRCGFGPTGDYADVYRVTAAYAIYIHGATTSGGGTRLGIALTGSAKDMAGASSPRVNCASTGALESEIARLVRETF